MNADLARLIHLQELDSTAERARRHIADMPDRLEALDLRLTAAQAALDAARERLAASQAARRTVEKDLAAIQTRLSRFKDQLMEVKTNKEYQAMQKEIAAAEHEVRTHEDIVLERMLEADELALAVKDAEQELDGTRKAITEEREGLQRQEAEINRRLEQVASERSQLVAEVAPDYLSLFEHVARQRKGVAVVEARDGHCSLCHVRLRPQVYNEIRRNERLIQCESCLRILYFAPTSAQAGA